jgi:Haemolymph juvenile hormone binding protein (JHBP)
MTDVDCVACVAFSRLYVQMDNLFNGDKALGDNMNMFMNENWQDILNELKPAFSEAIGQILENIINNVFSKFAYSEAWLDTAE